MSNATPTPPRSMNPGISADLEAADPRLLAKKPDDSARLRARRSRRAATIARASRARALRAPLGMPQPSVGGARPAARRAVAPGRRPARRPQPARRRRRRRPPPPRLRRPAHRRSSRSCPRPRRPWLDDARRRRGRADRAQPDERYLCGHYLAYLLGGSRRQGLPPPPAARPASTPTAPGCCWR